MKLPKLKNQTVSVPAGGTEIENLLGAAQEDAGLEKLLKFKKGEFFIGEEEIPLGTAYIAHAIGWTKSWTKFVDGEVAERRVYRVAKGERPPERDELDDNDKDHWPEGLDGRPADPWSYQFLLPLEDTATGEVVIFTTSSFGGRRAVSDLCLAYAKQTKKVANCGQPIVKLAMVEMPTKRFGRVPRPQFDVIGWDNPPAGIAVVPDESPPDEDAGFVERDGFNDEVPF